MAVRVDHESAKVKGELADARKATDQAIRKAYDVLNALAVLSSSASLKALISVLFGIEERAKLYYISGGKTGGDTPTPTPDGGSSDDSGDGGSDDQGGGDDGGDTPTPTPDPTPDPSGDGDIDSTGGDE